MAKARLQKEHKGDSKHGVVAGPLDPAFEKDYPNLWAYLYQDRYEDNSTRLTATLLLFLDDGFVKGCLHDREQRRSFFRAGGSLDSVLAALEEALEGGSADWRAKKF